MRILLLGLLFFALQSLVSAQDIFIPFKGEKEIIKIKDINNEAGNIENGYLDRIGDKCGDYFLYQEIRDQKILSFGVSITRDEYSREVPTIERIGISLLVIKLDDNATVPTAKWFSSDNHQLMIIRISNKDYEVASCLPKPNKQLLDLIK